MRVRLALLLSLLVCLSGGFAYAMTSTNYGIKWDSINSGGNDTSTSTNFGLRDTIGEQATGFTTSTNYTLSAGYRTGDSDVGSISFILNTQDNSTQVPYTAYTSSSPYTVTVSSTSGYAVDNMIAVVENLGLSQHIAIGRITSIAGNVFTVDSWDGSPSLINATPSGGDDYVFRLHGNSADLGTLVVTTPKTSLTGTRVSTNSINGYTVYVVSDGNLRYTTSTFITNVSDGAVTLGSEEYGWRVFGDSATNTSMDFPFTTSSQAIQSSLVPVNDQRVGLEYKVAIATSTPAGNYSQVITYLMTVNF